MMGTWSHWGTPAVQTGSWSVRMAIPIGASIAISPYVLVPGILIPARGYYPFTRTFAGTDGDPHNYGPIRTPLREGPCRIGLIASTTIESGTATTGDVVFANNTRIVSDAADFAALTAPYPMIRLLQSGDPISPWVQITAVTQTVSAGDTVSTGTPVTLPFVGYDAETKPAVTWELLDSTAVTLLAVHFREATA